MQVGHFRFQGQGHVVGFGLGGEAPSQASKSALPGRMMFSTMPTTEPTAKPESATVTPPTSKVTARPAL